MTSCSELPGHLPLFLSPPASQSADTQIPTTDPLPNLKETGPASVVTPNTLLTNSSQIATSTPTLARTRQISEAPPATSLPSLTPTPSQAPNLISYFLFIAEGKLKRWDHFTQRIETLAEDVVEYSVSQNGQKIALLENKAIAANGVALYRLALLDLETGQTTTIIPDTARIYDLSISPDGRWIAYTSQENGGTIYTLPLETDAQVSKMGECVLEHELHCLSEVVWSPDSSTLLWSDERGVWISDLKQTTPQLVLAKNLQIQDPQGETNEIQVTYEQLSWSPTGRYALAVVSPIASDVRWQGIVDTLTNRLAQIPETYEFKEQSTSATWMPDGELIVAHRSDAQAEQYPFLELWSILPTRDELLKLEGTFELPTNSITTNPLYAEARINFYPKWLAAINDRQVALALTPQDDQFPPTLFIYDLKYDLFEKLNEIIYDADSVMVSPDLAGAVITGWHEEILFAPADSAPIVDMRPIFGAKIESPTWLPLESLHP
jgi:WD40 repeat protein